MLNRCTVVALERTEQKYSLNLSRSIGTPNITSKGKLESRSVLIPVYDSSSAAPNPTATSPTDVNGGSGEKAKKPLIEEIESTSAESEHLHAAAVMAEGAREVLEKPQWQISRPNATTNEIHLTVSMPKAVRTSAHTGFALVDDHPLFRIKSRWRSRPLTLSHAESFSTAPRTTLSTKRLIPRFLETSKCGTRRQNGTRRVASS